LAAQPDDDHHFLGWTQDCKNTKKPLCRLVVDSDKTIIPIFQRPNSVNGYISGNGRLFSDSKDLNCNVNCQASLDPGSTITLQAKSNPGYYVSEWLGSCAEASLLECTITTDQETHVVALTKPVDQHLLLVAKPEHARVFSDPPGIDCGRHSDQCVGLFDLVNLKLDLEPGYGFSEWTGCDQNDRIECRLQMHDNKVVSVSTAIAPEDGLRFLGPDLDVTGPKNRPDGIKDLHLQLLHRIETGNSLMDGRCSVYDSSDQSKPKNGWSAKAEKYRMVIHKDGVELDLINDAVAYSEGGIIRYDIYIPYNDKPGYLAKGLVYKIDLIMSSKEGVQSNSSYNVLIK
jgi:hypothetical protein